MNIIAYYLSKKVYCYFGITNAQYAVLSTFERSWLCRKVNDGMEINGPYASSEGAAKRYPNMPKIPYLKMAFLALSLAHSSNSSLGQPNGFSLDNLKKLSYQLFNSAYSVFLASSMKFFKIPRNNQLSSTPLSSAPISIQSVSSEPVLMIPDFENVVNVEIFSGKGMRLGNWSVGDVFVGSVDGTKVAVKVCANFYLFKN